MKRGMLRIVAVLLVYLCSINTVFAEGDRYAASSALAKGKWVKISVENTGIYKVTFAELTKMGFSDPAKVSIHGYGGWPLEEDFRKTYTDDVPAVSVWKGSDYLLFYAKGPIKWEYSDKLKTFIHTNNPYSTRGYYFITDATETKEMETVPLVSGEAAVTVTTFDDYFLHEKELKSVNKSGRELFGEYINGGTQSLSFTMSIPGITNNAGRATMRFIARPKSTYGASTLTVDGTDILRLDISPVSIDSPYTKAHAEENTVAWTRDKKETVDIQISYNKTGDENVYLDYLSLLAERKLQLYEDVTFFRSLASRDNTTRFIIENADQNTVVFDVTDGISPKRMETKLTGSQLSFTNPFSFILKEFVVVKTTKALGQIKNEGEITNQDLHALPQTDMIIIAHKALKAEAERLAEAHRTKDNLSVAVIDPVTIYNEFSSGTPDATAYRRFMKMFYDRQTAESDAPKYLLLFGDGAYDNRKLTDDWKGMDMSNMLLTYQSQESLNAYSYVTDDYFGFLADDEGSYLPNGMLALGIGRLPVRTLAEATAAVDKICLYMENKETGSWKNKLSFLADDGNGDDKYTADHAKRSNQYADTIRKNQPDFLVNKLFFDAYKKDNTSGKESYPDVRANLQKQLKEGLLVLNYVGHGNTTSLSDEKVLTQSDIVQFTYKKLPLWITATCDFTRFDDINTSAGEDVFLKKSGGIALFTTTRVVFAEQNHALNKALLKNLFLKRNGIRLTLGDVMKATKRELKGDANKLNFILVGDPALKLAYPEYKIEVTAINGIQLTGEPIHFKALEKITVKGSILNHSSQLFPDFNGDLDITVLDSKRTLSTLGNNNKESIFDFIDYPNTLYIGKETVENGNFEFTFTVPKDISYSSDYGIMNLYASDPTSGNEAQGSYQNFLVGGTIVNPENDTDGPEIRSLYLNDTTFVDGGKVNATPFFVAKLWDKSGVNISGSSIGHDMMLTIDNQVSLSYNLNAYYQLLSNSENEGIVKFLLPELSAGTHTAEFKVWDIVNNSTVATFTFEVVEGLKPTLIDIAASPIPARENINFYIYHNRPESTIQVTLFVYDIAGKLVWKHTENGESEISRPYMVNWNLANGAGARVGTGVYLYKASISTKNSKEATQAKKLIILAQ